MRFQLNIPTRIHFGCGIMEEALRKEKNILSGRVLVVCSGSAEKYGVIERISDALAQEGALGHLVRFSGITANPKLDEVNRGIDVAIENKINVVLGVGGGSVLDAAKAIAAGAGAREHIDRFFFDGAQPGEQTLPIVAIPTTAGTGSELSKSAILSCPGKHMKSGVRGERLYPVAAIVDPELTYTVPRTVTMETGFDVLAHAIESFVSRAANYFTKALSVQAILIASRSMRALAEDLDDHDAREKISYASMAMGINLGNASTVLPHRMQYPVGALTDTGHGKGLIALYPSWIMHTYRYSKEKFDCIGGLMSGKPCSSLEGFEDIFGNFMEHTCGKTSLRDFGLGTEDAERLAGMVTGNISLDPAGEVPDIVYGIYKSALMQDKDR